MARSTKHQIIRDLGDGLVMRRATPEDREELGAFIGRIFGGGPDSIMSSWARGILAGLHPTSKARDFSIVEDTTRGKIVSTIYLFVKRWSYGGVTLGVGCPEFVATDPEYRKRGLMRAQFEVIHAWSKAYGHLAQAINGIPFFYRQFGYELCWELGAGREWPRAPVPQLKEGEEEPYRVRPAAKEDLPFVARTYAQGMTRYLVSAAVSSRKLWDYYLFQRGPIENFHIIEAAGGERLGYLTHGEGVKAPGVMGIEWYELKPGVSWLAVHPSVLRYLARKGAEYAARDNESFATIRFYLGAEHPLYQAAPGLVPAPQNDWALYVRVPDLPAFLRHIAPVLEQRLANSVAPGWTGELRLSFYRDGLRLAFARGKLIVAEVWAPIRDQESARFRDQSFLQLLLGVRSLEELRAASADCYPCTTEAWAVLDILFPRQASSVWASL